MKANLSTVTSDLLRGTAKLLRIGGVTPRRALMGVVPRVPLKTGISY